MPFSQHDACGPNQALPVAVVVVGVGDGDGDGFSAMKH
jgi:hypothetical protein